MTISATSALVEPADATQRFPHDVGLRRELRGGLEMHPAAPSAPREAVQADRLHPIVGCLQHVVDAATREVLLRLGDIDLDELARQRTGDEHDPPVVGSPHGVAAGDETVGTNGQ